MIVQERQRKIPQLERINTGDYKGEYLTLSELLSHFKKVVDTEFGKDKTFWVVAEIAKISEKNHCFLELVEKDDNLLQQEIKASVKAIIWKENYEGIREYFYEKTGEHLRMGMKILFQCHFNFHKVHGLSVIIIAIIPEFTLGEMYLKKEEVIRKLEKENLVNRNKELFLPPVIQKIAVIASSHSASLGDFVTFLENNSYGFKFYYYVFDTFVQGEGAEESIMSSLEKVKRHRDFFEVVVIIRGGGSKVDLDCFDNFEIAKYVALFPLPVITGIGHQKDTSCVDIVAYKYCITPTACAEFFIDRAYSFFTKCSQLYRQLSNTVLRLIENNNNLLDKKCSTLEYGLKQILSERRHQLKEILKQLSYSGYQFVGDSGRYIKEKSTELKNAVKQILMEGKYKVNEKVNELRNALMQVLTEETSEIKRIEKSIKLLDPRNVLKRGYSITYCANKVIKDIKILKRGSEITTKLYKGTIKSMVEELFEEGERG